MNEVHLNPGGIVGAVLAPGLVFAVECYRPGNEIGRSKPVVASDSK
jgi:hypothetical protein